MDKNFTVKQFVFLLVSGLFIFQGCKDRPEFATRLFKKFNNKVFKDLDTAGYNPVFRKVLQQKQKDLKYRGIISKYYKNKNYEPLFISKFLPEDDIQLVLQRFENAKDHGLNPELFNYTELKGLTNQFYDHKIIKTADEAYQAMANLEIELAESLLFYSNTLGYGLTDPHKLFKEYYTSTFYPDSASMAKVFEIRNMKSYLDSIQPKNPEYLSLQKGLKANFVYRDLTLTDTRKTIELNLERLRWKNKPTTNRYVWVNIADYSLKYVENGKPKLSMKVCVGKALSNPTPQLSSEIYNAQVNPVWNIPYSIAKKEMLHQLVRNRSYLSRRNISVYKNNGKKIDASSINWSKISPRNIPYSFRQAPGSYNSLGKIKFQFVNSSSVYLHDTPSKYPFQLEKRAVSHGCVRLEKPLELAKAIYGEGEQYERIEKEFATSTTTTRNIAVKPKIAVFIDYRTCFVDENGQIQIRPDVYQLDTILYSKMKSKKALSAAL